MAGRTDLFAFTLPSTVGTSPELSGPGAPTGVVPGVPGQTYVDTNNNNLWLKITGVQALGWQLIGVKSVPVVTVNANAGQSAFSGTGSPVGVVFPLTAAAFYTQIDSVPPGLIWSWYSGAWHQ